MPLPLQPPARSVKDDVQVSTSNPEPRGHRRAVEAFDHQVLEGTTLALREKAKTPKNCFAILAEVVAVITGGELLIEISEHLQAREQAGMGTTARALFQNRPGRGATSPAIREHGLRDLLGKILVPAAVPPPGVQHSAQSREVEIIRLPASGFRRG